MLPPEPPLGPAPGTALRAYIPLTPVLDTLLQMTASVGMCITAFVLAAAGFSLSSNSTVEQHDTLSESEGLRLNLPQLKQPQGSHSGWGK